MPSRLLFRARRIPGLPTIITGPLAIPTACQTFKPSRTGRFPNRENAGGSRLQVKFVDIIMRQLRDPRTGRIMMKSRDPIY